ncbi:gamma-tubulin complex DGRIP91 SPC98 component [Coniophora puteana RWD-64-598 SS2]|uniref:Gamma-tubulin complex DGRIP91 SPC98 component n=1 Tax=Coniophora puteana (strain RWD-64-598) TaxID=741705 RepID=A0A5M3MBT5_CONPW|nr:gamma-tubulin complex DGRIP91 SPC98 component [Coniophora puteana RWD-64-598 SS2]EIW76095.1 gamma-tubulin complex DGRIP91 SPC98 component [Coniophora puteana RWD-64-598 SS2]
MPPLSASIHQLVALLVPATRNDDTLRDDLVAHATDILSSHIGQSNSTDTAHLTSLIRRHLSQSNASPNASLQFTNLNARLQAQPALARKHDALLFLHTLASSSRPQPPSILSPKSPSPLPIPSPLPTPVDPQSTSRSKAAILAEYRARIGKPHVPEHLLLRDALYLLQGISGKHISLHDGNLTFHHDSKYTITAPLKSLLHRLAEVGHLYARVDAFVRSRDVSSSLLPPSSAHPSHNTLTPPQVGMIEQSLAHHLQSQLTQYYRLIAVLESQLNSAPSSSPDQSGLTLKRLDVWINEWRLRMRMMSVCVEGAKGTQGGALVNLIHSYTDNGDPFVRSFTDELLEEVSKPFFLTLHKWLFSGDLYDPYAEFFVSVDPELADPRHAGPLGSFDAVLPMDNEDMSSDARESGLRMWESKYRFRKDMLPMFVDETFGRKIFSTGKSLNFIRYTCHDSDWATTRDRMSSAHQTHARGTLSYTDIPGLERSIDAAYKTASARLFEILIDKFHLTTHLKALKSYLLLGHGDFASQLLDALAPSLGRAASTLYRHNLTATLESALRSTSAADDAGGAGEVLRRLDVRVLPYGQGEVGWDVFTLEYKVDAPADTVLDPESMGAYLKLFSHLWRMKRVESALRDAWMRAARGRRGDWHRIRLAMAEMIHFVRQMTAYCQLEVIECAWIELMEFLNKREGDLDGMIDAHRTYLERMVKKALMLSPKAGREENLLNQVRDAFGTILQFRDAMDSFYNSCLSEAAAIEQEHDLERLRKLVEEYAQTFTEQASGIVHSLQTHPDLDCRFLGIRMSFSDYYRRGK